MDNPETEPKADIPGVEEKRRPGRPPKAVTKAAIGNTSTNYVPSAERNNLDQALQPTGMGTVAGGLDFDESDLTEVSEAWRAEKIVPGLAKIAAEADDSPSPISAPEAGEKLFPVRMLRNYRPATDRWYPILLNGKLGKAPTEGESVKVKAGYKIALPMSEAKQVIARGLAERADALPD